MRSILLICAVWLLVFASGCKRSGQQSTNNSAGTAEVSNHSAGDRTRAREQLEKGKEFYRNDQDDEAVQAFQEAVKFDPDLAEGHFRLGLGYESLGKREEAEAEYKKAIAAYKKYLEDNRNDPEAHYDLAQTYAGLGQYSEAIREYREATKLKEDDPENYRAQDGLDEAKEGINRIRDGRKHQVDLLKKQKAEELKKAGEGAASPTPQN